MTHKPHEPGPNPAPDPAPKPLDPAPRPHPLPRVARSIKACELGQRRVPVSP